MNTDIQGTRRCTFDAPAPPKALEMAFKGIGLFPKILTVMRATAPDPSSQFDMNIFNLCNTT